MTNPPVRVQYRDDALATLVAYAASGVDGVVRLQRRPVSALLRRRRGSGPDRSAIELGRDPAGTLEVSVRLVSRLQPAPHLVIAAVADAVRAQLNVVGETRTTVEITVTDVRR